MRNALWPDIGIACCERHVTYIRAVVNCQSTPDYHDDAVWQLMLMPARIRTRLEIPARNPDSIVVNRNRRTRMCRAGKCHGASPFPLHGFIPVF